MKVKNLKVFGDSQIIVDQVRKRIHCNFPHLVRYQHEAWSLIDNFDSFNITYIPRGKNQDANLMVGMATKLLPDLRLNNNKYYFELIFRPSVPDNISNWQVSEGDDQILEFLHCEKTFKNAVIDEKEHEKCMNGSEDEEKYHPNIIPRSVVKMEHFYDLHDKFQKLTNCKTHRSSMKYDSINLGTKEDPKNVNLGLDSLHEKRLHL